MKCFLHDRECGIGCRAWSASRDCCLLLRYIEQMVEWGEADIEVEDGAEYA